MNKKKGGGDTLRKSISDDREGDGTISSCVSADKMEGALSSSSSYMQEAKKNI